MAKNLDNLTCALQDKGVLMTVTVRRWRGRRKLRPEDIGLDPNQIDGDLFALGQKCLVGKEVLDKFSRREGEIRRLVDAAGFPFLGIARYIPNNVLDELLIKLDEQKEAFDADVRAFVGDHENVRAVALRRWRAYAETRGMDAPATTKLLETIEASFPTPAQLIEKFEVSTLIFQIDTPDRPTLEQQFTDVRAKAARRAQEEIQATSAAFVAECVTRLRQETATLCEEVLKTVQGTANLSQKTVNRLTTFMDRFQALNFANDVQMARQIENFRQSLLTADEYRGDLSKVMTLSEGLQSLRSEALKLIETEEMPEELLGVRPLRALVQNKKE